MLTELGTPAIFATAALEAVVAVVLPRLGPNASSLESARVEVDAFVALVYIRLRDPADGAFLGRL